MGDGTAGRPASIARMLAIDGWTHPIALSPMAGAGTAALAAAVTEAGGLGAISVGALDAMRARAAIAEVRERTRGAFNVNVFCHQPARSQPAVEAAWLAHLRPAFAQFGAAPPPLLREIYRSFLVDDALLAVLVETRPRVVSCHFGLPSPDAVRALRGAGTRLFATVTSVAEAHTAIAAGIDVLVAQGYEAGGHRGVFDERAPDAQLGTLALVRELAAAVRAPVLAAGGIMTGAEIRAAIEAGAIGAQLGTAFLACPESGIEDAHRHLLGRASETVMTRAMSGRPARLIANRLTAIEDGVPPAYPIAYDAAKALHAVARAHGEHGYGPQLAGTGAPRARAMPAAALVATLVRELAA